MSYFNVPYLPLQFSDDGVGTPMTVYYFIYDGRVLTETVNFMCPEDKLDNHSYTRRLLLWHTEGAGSKRLRRMRDSNKILFHYTKPNRWACVKDSKTGADTFDYEMTSKEKTFLALAAEPV